MESYTENEIKAISKFITEITMRLPIEIGSKVYTDMGEGKVLSEGYFENEYKVYMIHKGYEQDFKISDLKSGETLLSKHGIIQCLELIK